MTHQIPSAEAYASEPVRFPPLVVRLAVITGDYPWHQHPRSDELFLVMEGRFEIELADGLTLRLGPWQSVVVPAGTLQRTRGIGRTVNLCF